MVLCTIERFKYHCRLPKFHPSQKPWLTSNWPLKSWSLLGHICFSCYRIYVMILCNWLILWQNALYLYLGRLRLCLTTSRNYVSRSSVEAFKFVQEIKQESSNSLKLDSWSIPSRHLYLSRFKNFRFQHDFLGIRESVYGLSFLLTLDT